jgi:hypothetical protein
MRRKTVTRAEQSLLFGHDPAFPWDARHQSGTRHR